MIIDYSAVKRRPYGARRFSDIEMSPSVGELLEWGTEVLRKSGIEDCEISAELLLRSVLNLERSQLLINRRTPVAPDTHSKYTRLVEQRSKHVPLQHLVGWVDFYNVRLKCDSRALIPRPETEILVETVIRRLKRFSKPTILDIGTGSGNIAIALAKNVPGSLVTGVDISTDALELARSNAETNEVTDNTKWIMGDIRNEGFVKSLGLFDCVVSNPPYVFIEEKDRLQPEIVQFEPAVALFSGDGPLIFFKTIISTLLYILRRGGLLAFEVGMGQARDVSDLMRADFKDIEITKDLAAIDRVVTGIYAGSH